MPLMMARPRKNPKTGIYEFRRVVPDDLRALVGKREEKRSLGTRDFEEAKRRHAKHWLKVEARWANLRRGRTTLTERQAHEAAAPIYDNWLAIHREQPSWQFDWDTSVYDELWTRPGHDPERHYGDAVSITDLMIRGMRRFCFQQADIKIEDDGLILDSWDRENLA